MTRLKIALMAGGDSPEREIALQSAAQIESALDHEKYDITVIDLHHRDWHYTAPDGDRKSTRLNSSHDRQSRMPSSA